jgi:hypothetical protein
MSTRQSRRAYRLILLSCTALATVPFRLAAQTDGTCINVNDRNGREFGCFITARQELGALPKDSALFWHLDRYPTLAAAESMKGGRGTVVESLGSIWLFTVGPANWRPTSGERIATVGPIPLVNASEYAAVYMEGVFKPGMASVVHRHPGAEAWYTLEGGMCLETPAGTIVQRSGDQGVMIPSCPPMELTGIGEQVRRSLVLILQDTSKPRSTVANDWIPKGLCERLLPAPS